MNVSENFVDFSGFFIGKVMEIDRYQRKAAIYIPKLMPMLSNSYVRNVQQYADIKDMKISVKINQVVNLTNNIWGTPENIHLCLPKIGSKVICYFLEEDPKQLYFRPFNVNNDYSDDEEDIKNGYIRASI